MTFRYERGLPDATDPPPFIKFGCWQPSSDGLLSGERIFLSLKNLEAAYYETRGHDFDVTKHVSLRPINPIALPTLDFPGHYSRRLNVPMNESAFGTLLSQTLPAAPYTLFPQDNFTEGIYIDYRAFDAQNFTPCYEFGSDSPIPPLATQT
ncbi:hypothetical protein BKA61DRAFT_582919 [Leptodontidium sp. MPI-SDFR-AT-0119]|nr:hypothetical protein BKA61DRAFT_582919 [Leptodontidium sp. MPI-SDFR-AT-0119]